MGIDAAKLRGLIIQALAQGKLGRQVVGLNLHKRDLQIVTGSGVKIRMGGGREKSQSEEESGKKRS